MSTIVMTGTGGALGGAVVRALIGSGHAVAALEPARGAARMAALETELGPSFSAHTGDAGDDAACASALPAIEQRHGAPTGAVLIAGGWQGGKPLHAGGGGEWRAMLDSNLETVRAALAALVPGMVARKAGSIVVIGSRAAVQPWTSANAAAYAAAKAGAVALAQAVAAETTPHGVRINAVLPSVIDTAANRAAMGEADAARWVTPGSLAAVSGFLLSDAARDVSGAALPVYGRA